MRLLHCETKEILEFGKAPPQYAILSHTWEKEELTFGQMAEAKTLLREGKASATTEQQGWFKIARACEQAPNNVAKFVWVDTVCIDKTSSVELSEAINSMYEWYRKARVCYVYLFDVCNQKLENKCPYCNTPAVPFEKSRWFTRGWTLQELIAPKSVVFFDRHWIQLTTKKNSLAALSKITGVDEIVLDGGSLRLASIARIMSWAARRRTTRIEDRAYSLLGLFGISMPLLYGEGNTAFIRLQETLIETYDDQSVFAWGLNGPRNLAWNGIMALSPSAFTGSANVYPVARTGLRREPPAVTSRGIHLHTCVVDADKTASDMSGVVLLDCFDIALNSSATPSSLIGIDVVFLDESRRHCERKRDSMLRHVECYEIPPMKDVYALKSSSTLSAATQVVSGSEVHIRNLPTWPDSYPCTKMSKYDATRTVHSIEGHYSMRLVVSSCAFVVFPKTEAGATYPEKGFYVQTHIPHLVVYIYNVPESDGRKGTDVTFRRLCIAVRLYRGFSSVKESLKKRGSDLQPSELSSSAIEFRQDGLRLNVRLSSPLMGNASCLDIFAHPDDGPASYTRAEDWHGAGKLVQ